MHLFWWLATGPLGPVFQHAVLAWIFLVLYLLFGDAVRNFYLASLVLLIVLTIPIRNALKRLEKNYNEKHF